MIRKLGLSVVESSVHGFDVVIEILLAFLALVTMITDSVTALIEKAIS